MSEREDRPWPDSYDKEDKQHSIWWSDQMQQVKSTIYEIQKEVAERNDVTIAGSHTAVKQDGKHEVKISVTVEGESFENRLEENDKKTDEVDD